MVVSNDIVNRCGPSFPSRLKAAANCEAGALAIGYEAAKTVLDVDRLWAKVDLLDGKIPAAGQMALYRRLSATLRGATFWLAHRAARERLTVNRIVERYAAGFKTLRDLSPDILSQVERAVVAGRTTELTEAGAPQDLAQATAVLQSLTTAGDMIDLAGASSWPLPHVAQLYHRAGEAFGFDRLRQVVGRYTVGDQFERTAVRRLVEELLAEQTTVTQAIMAFAASPQAGESADAADDAIASWSALRPDVVQNARHTLESIETSGGAWTFAKLTIANAALRELATAASARGRAR
jgi:glutamate dehydrogenase